MIRPNAPARAAAYASVIASVILSAPCPGAPWRPGLAVLDRQARGDGEAPGIDIALKRLVRGHDGDLDRQAELLRERVGEARNRHGGAGQERAGHGLRVVLHPVEVER